MLHRYGRFEPSLGGTHSGPWTGNEVKLRLRNEIDPHLSFGSFNGRVSLARRNRVALAEKLEMVDERLHALLHRSTGRRHKLVVINADCTLRDLVQTL